MALTQQQRELAGLAHSRTETSEESIGVRHLGNETERKVTIQPDMILKNLD